MRLLKKLLLAIVLLIVLACLKILFVKWLPVSVFFFVNLFGSLQLLILLWALITGALESLAWRRSPPRRARRNAMLAFLSVVVLAECGFGLLLYHPSAIPRGWRDAFRTYYMLYDRNILQYDRAVARYDTALFYRWKSNTATVFRNVEFSDSFRIDARGFRNEPKTTNKIRVICLGDSYTVGWGVRQEEAYPQQLEKMLGVPVLNTGVSSYGTVREVASIRALDKDSVKAVVIQYCNNDAPENQTWFDHNRKLPVSPESAYDSACDQVRWSGLYFPGKYFCTITKIWLKNALGRLRHHPQPSADSPAPDNFAPGASPDSSGAHDARLFLDVLKHSGWDFDKLQIVVFSIDETDTSIRMIPMLARELRSPENTTFFKGRLHILPLPPLLNDSDYYILDGHLRASGQQKIARALADTLRSLQPLP